MIRFSPNPNRANLIRWHEWSDDAFTKAQAEDKPVMLFLTAFWCRFCQRMDEGAFSDDENIALLNAYFVAVRVEDTQRPDVNTRYNLNGWPTIAFMAPAGELLGVTNYLPSEEFGNLLAQHIHGLSGKEGRNPVGAKQFGRDSFRHNGRSERAATRLAPPYRKSPRSSWRLRTAFTAAMAAARNSSIRKRTISCFPAMRRRKTLVTSITSASPWTG